MSPVFGAESCATPAQRTERVSKLIEMVDKLRSRIERVSPSDAKFIRDELEEALSQENKQRSSILFRNPFYHPLQVHDAVDKVVGHLSKAKDVSLKEQAIQVIEALGAFGSIVSSMSSYMDFDASRQERILNDNQRENISMQYTMLPYRLARFARCLTTELREP